MNPDFNINLYDALTAHVNTLLKENAPIAYKHLITELDDNPFEIYLRLSELNVSVFLTFHSDKVKKIRKIWEEIELLFHSKLIKSFSVKEKTFSNNYGDDNDVSFYLSLRVYLNNEFVQKIIKEVSEYNPPTDL